MASTEPQTKDVEQEITVTVEKPDDASLSRETILATQKAGQLDVIRNQGDHTTALEQIGYLSKLKKKIEEYWRPVKQATNNAHKETTKKEREMLDPVKTALSNLNRLCTDYEEEERKRAEELKRQLQAKADQEEQERQARLAVAVAEEGDTAEADRILEEPVAAPAVTVQPQFGKAEGVSARGTWSAEVTDLSALAKFAVDNNRVAEMLQANQPALNALARAAKAGLQIPGVTPKKKTSRY